MTPRYWPCSWRGHWARQAGKGGFSEECRGLSFSLIGGSDVEGMTKERGDPVNFNYGPSQFSQGCSIVLLKGNQWGDKLLWTAAPFICGVVVCMPGCYSRNVCVYICLCVSLFGRHLYKCAALSIYDNWMLWSICVLLVYFLWVALMACYLSKPVFKRLLMGVHMHHPLTLSSATMFLSHNNTVKVFLKVVFALSSPCQIQDCLMADECRLALVCWEIFVAELIEWFWWCNAPIWSCHRDALCLKSSRLGNRINTGVCSLVEHGRITLGLG